MSWLSFNDSLNNIKGQISSFASGVLTDELGNDSDVSPELAGAKKKIEELQRLCDSQGSEILFLKNQPSSAAQNQQEDEHELLDARNGASWAWITPDLQDRTTHLDPSNNKTISDLKGKVDTLQNEKKELENSLEQLDYDCQHTTDKLVALKDAIQTEYNNLKSDFDDLKKEYGVLMNENLEKQKTIESLRTTCNTSSQYEEIENNCRQLATENEKLLAQLSSLGKELENKTADISNKDEEILKQHKKYEPMIAKLEASETAASSTGKEFVEENTRLEMTNTDMFKKYSACKEELEIIKTQNGELSASNMQLLSMKKELEKSEDELCRLKTENEDLKLVSAIGEEFQTLEKNFANLKLDHKKLLHEKQNLHENYVKIITENMQKYIENESESQISTSDSHEDPQIHEFSSKVETILKLLLDFKWKTESLEKELCEITQDKNRVMTEKNFEIEKLLKNSEILSQEVITKTQAIRDCEEDCSELMKNNNLLLAELQGYRNNSGLQTISESNEDNLLLMENQLDMANKRIQELELIISDIDNCKQESNIETQTELDYIKKQLNMTGQELNKSKTEYQDLEANYSKLSNDYTHLKNEFLKIQTLHNSCTKDKQELKTTIDRLEVDSENREYKFAEANINMESLKEEHENYRREIEDLQLANNKLESGNINARSKNEMLQNQVVNLKALLASEVAAKETQIRGLVEKMQIAKMSETSLKLQVDTGCKELQAVSETKKVLEIKYNKLRESFQELQSVSKADADGGCSSEIDRALTINNQELQQVKEAENALKESGTENAEIASKISELNQELSAMLQEKLNFERQCLALQAELNKVNIEQDEHFKKILFLEAQLNELNKSRNELISVVTTKHNENIQYHSEIQRLSQILSAESEKCHMLEVKLEEESEKCQMLKSQLESVDEMGTSNEDMTRRLEENDQMSEDLQRRNVEIDNLTDQNNFLREKCEILAQNLLQEQANVQKVLSARSAVTEKEQALSKELERLRAHLLEIEAMYTQELVQAEQKNQEMQAKMNEIQKREKDSSSIYTSVSIRANQQVETLQNQLHLVTNQRDELRKKMSDTEDQINKQTAALTNLQLVLEQFQKDKEKDVFLETERIRRQINAEKHIQEELRNEIINVKSQLDESKQGLQAATRLTDQLEKSKQHVIDMKTEVTKLQEKLSKTEEQYKEVTTQTDAKVDKSLIKNLIIGFITSNSVTFNKDQNQILKIIATVLDFNQKENEKIKLYDQQHSGWLGAILHPQGSSSNQNMTQQSLSEAFVRFLEKESKPIVLPNLLNSVHPLTVEESTGKTSTRQSPLVLSEVVLPTFADFRQSRNSSSILKDVLKDNS